MKVEFRKTPSGEVAIIPRAEYERLMVLSNEAEEDIGTARLVAKAKRDKGVRLPLSVVQQLANGENPIRVLRQFRGMTQADLATAEGVQITQNYLSDLETGKRKGPIALHRKLAKALDVPLDCLDPIAVTDQEAEPERFARRKSVIAGMKRLRGQR
ncbi:helix-turn-helix transcriptional regulator [Tardiphaga sp. vice352]|uniref:helix-turn-helix transcriptional regulator n=1 Tax=unclassified Tardiphaga TaxID=2631404 RepID=UPI001163E46C|nr:MULTISPECIES: helix-turn-helix transcriptional regulator [unclassified Tardiphaga]MBC7583031.1 helix-turn-helix transcriptional regulator [Tardiphaga sp.]QDM16605.1 helix-turn-helix transcriptional regulator [Tardiphaga sp. vice278]QDM21629.1 helix-turn-helix transcriptional regulator [Tardiphaga sp. vice154]QDM26815.1 helix-turn-helix transcriptional regulator [Tardiphaga sp. vice304]QDM31879.1 helix-turn-helix transcriptional regulator [Tardiphaga sp. vice352]